MYMKTRILFVGNSFTARNNLPNLLAQLVEAGGKGALEWKLVSGAGQHFNKGDVAALLRDASWDAVVLQEQRLPAKNAARMVDNVRDLNALIGQASPAILYDCRCAQTAISAAYAEWTAGSAVVPAGLAWQLCLLQEPQIVYHDKDGSHPTRQHGDLRILQGAFCWPCKENTHADIAVSEAEQIALQECARQAVSAFRKGAFSYAHADGLCRYTGRRWTRADDAARGL